MSTFCIPTRHGIITRQPFLISFFIVLFLNNYCLLKKLEKLSSSFSPVSISYGYFKCLK